MHMDKKGYVLAITTVMLVITSMLIMLGYSLFLTHYSKSNNDYKKTLDRLSVEVTAQAIYVASTKVVLSNNDFNITIDDVTYVVRFENELYSFEVEKIFEKYAIKIIVSFDSSYKINTWKIWSDLSRGNNNSN